MAADFLSLIGAIPSLISDFTGGTTAPYASQQKQLAGNQAQISNALLQGPNNPLYQQLYGQYQTQNRNNMQQSIADAQAQNRMNVNMGRTPLFSNERGSENIFRSMQQGYQNEGVQADQQTRAALTGASGPTLQGIAGYNSITPSAIAANKGQNQGYQSIYDLLRGMGNQGGQSQLQGAQGAGINPSMGSVGAGGYNSNYNPSSGYGPSGYGLQWQ